MFVDRDTDSGLIVARYANRQRIDQEEIADDAAEILLKDAVTAKRAAIEAAFAAAVAAGVEYGGKVLQIDDASRANISGQAVRAAAAVAGLNAVTWPETFAWRMLDNTYLPLSATDMLDMAQAASDRYIALRFRLGQLKDALAAATTADEVAAIDPSSGW